MINRRDIYATAQLLIKKHGIKAEDVVWDKVLEFIVCDDIKGGSVWFSVMHAISDLNLRKQQKYLH